MEKEEIKRISNRLDEIQRQFNGWTIKKKVEGKVFRRSAEEQRIMFEQMEKASLELSNMDSELRLKQVRLIESKEDPDPNYAMKQDNPVWILLKRIDELGKAVDELIEPINIHLNRRAGINHRVNDFIEEINNTANDVAENSGNDHFQEVKDLNELTLKLKRWQQDIANDYCVRNRDMGSLLFEKRNGVYIRDLLGTSFNRTLSRLGRHKKDTYYNMVKPLEMKRDGILKYLDELQVKKQPEKGGQERERANVLTEPPNLMALTIIPKYFDVTEKTLRRRTGERKRFTNYPDADGTMRLDTKVVAQYYSRLTDSPKK